GEPIAFKTSFAVTIYRETPFCPLGLLHEPERRWASVTKRGVGRTAWSRPLFTQFVAFLHRDGTPSRGLPAVRNGQRRPGGRERGRFDPSSRHVDVNEF